MGCLSYSGVARLLVQTKTRRSKVHQLKKRLANSSLQAQGIRRKRTKNEGRHVARCSLRHPGISGAHFRQPLVRPTLHTGRDCRSRASKRWSLCMSLRATKCTGHVEQIKSPFQLVQSHFPPFQSIPRFSLLAIPFGSTTELVKFQPHHSELFLFPAFLMQK